ERTAEADSITRDKLKWRRQFMWRINRIARLMGVTASVTFLAVAMMGSSVASAATSARPANHISAPKTHNTTLSPPKGCNNGNLCEYNSGNGGNLCFQTNRSRLWPGGCAFHNEGEYNRNGNAVFLIGVVAQWVIVNTFCSQGTTCC